MKAIVQYRYGSPDVLSLEDVPRPDPGEREVLVRVRAAGLNAGDWHMMRGTPFLIRLVMGGLVTPRYKVPGSDFAGRVEAVGGQVTHFEPGEEVFGDASGSSFGAFAEYVCVSAKALAVKPANVTFEQAAAVPVAANAALLALRDLGEVRGGEQVLVNGAAGGVGSFAVQLARSFGAEVTGVCSTRNLELVRSIGAHHVIDYTREDCTRGDRRYDLVVDAAAFRSARDYLRVLNPAGRYVMIGGATSRIFQVLLLGPWVARSGRRARFLASTPNADNLAALSRLLESGELVPIVDRRFELPQLPAAIRYLESGQARGKVVITV